MISFFTSGATGEAGRFSPTTGFLRLEGEPGDFRGETGRHSSATDLFRLEGVPGVFGGDGRCLCVDCLLDGSFVDEHRLLVSSEEPVACVLSRRGDDARCLDTDRCLGASPPVREDLGGGTDVLLRLLDWGRDDATLSEAPSVEGGFLDLPRVLVSPWCVRRSIRSSFLSSSVQARPEEEPPVDLRRGFTSAPLSVEGRPLDFPRDLVSPW